MDRSEILAAMSTLKLHGMKTAYDEIITTAIKRQHEPPRVVGDLLNAEISEKQARSIKYQTTIAKALSHELGRSASVWVASLDEPDLLCPLSVPADGHRACRLAVSSV